MPKKGAYDAQQRADMVAAQTRSITRMPRRGAQNQPAATYSLGPTAAISVAVLLFLAVGFIQIMPMTGYIPAIEKLLSERLQEPVNIGGLRFTLFPVPQLKVERIAIGPGQDVRIESALIPMSPAALFDDKKDSRDRANALTLTMTDSAPGCWTVRRPITRPGAAPKSIVSSCRCIELPPPGRHGYLAKGGGWQKSHCATPKLNQISCR